MELYESFVYLTESAIRQNAPKAVIWFPLGA